MSGWLTAADVAAVYRRERDHWKRIDNAQALLDDIEQMMAQKGLSRSTINRYDVARHVLNSRVAAKPEEPRLRVATPEESAWEADRPERFGPRDPALAQMDEIALANRVKSTSMADWGQERIRLGIAARSALDHLAGAFGN